MNETELKRIIEYKYGSVRAFAIENDIPYTTMRSILERGILNAKAETIFKICRVLNIKPEYIEGVDLEFAPHSSSPPQNGVLSKINDKVAQLSSDGQKSVLRYASDLLEQEEAEVAISEPAIF